jgi:hypothetical protein
MRWHISALPRVYKTNVLDSIIYIIMVSIIIIVQLTKEEEESRQPTQKKKERFGDLKWNKQRGEDQT